MNDEEIALSVDDHLVKVIGYQIQSETFVADSRLTNCNHPGERDSTTDERPLS